MFGGGIGFTEIILLAGIALIVLGPEKFPEFAKMAARFVKDIRGYANEIQREVAKEIKPVQRELDQLRRIDPEAYIDQLTRDDEEPEGSQPPNVEPEYGVDGAFEYDAWAGKPAGSAPADKSNGVSNGESAAKATGGSGESKDDAAEEHPERLDG